MSSSLIKAGFVNPGQGKKDKRVIDSNQAVFNRLQLLNELLEESYSEEDFMDGFSEGLNGEQVGSLLADQDGSILGEEYGDGQEMNGYGAPSAADVEGMLAEVNAEAENIIGNANATAEDIIAKANAEAEEIRSRAYEEGKAAGEEAGYQDGLAKTQALENELNAKIEQLEIEFEDRVAKLEPRFVEALTGIYSHVFNVDLSDKTELVLYLLRDAMRNIDGGKNFFIHVSRDDYTGVVAFKDTLESGLASSCTVEIIEDVSLSQGECFIETESGIFDCSLGTELELLKKELLLLSYKA